MREVVLKFECVTHAVTKVTFAESCCKHWKHFCNLLSHSCSVESRRQSLNILSDDQIDLGSKAGPGSVQAFAAISIQAETQVNFNSRKITLQGLKSAATSEPSSASLSAADDRSTRATSEDLVTEAVQVSEPNP